METCFFNLPFSQCEIYAPIVAKFFDMAIRCWWLIAEGQNDFRILLVHPLCTLAAVWTALYRGRSAGVWLIWAGLFHIFALLALMSLPTKNKPKKVPPLHPRQQRKENEAEASKMEFKPGKFKVSVQDLADSNQREVSYFLANQKPSKTQSGEDINTSEAFLQGLSDTAYITGDEDKNLALKMKELFTHGVINKNEFVNSLAAIAFKDKSSLPENIKKDAFGRAKYANDDQRLTVDMAEKMFADNCVDKSDVVAVCADKIVSLEAAKQQTGFGKAKRAWEHLLDDLK